MNKEMNKKMSKKLNLVPLPGSVVIYKNEEEKNTLLKLYEEVNWKWYDGDAATVKSKRFPSKGGLTIGPKFTWGTKQFFDGKYNLLSLEELSIFMREE